MVVIWRYVRRLHIFMQFYIFMDAAKKSEIYILFHLLNILTSTLFWIFYVYFSISCAFSIFLRFYSFHESIDSLVVCSRSKKVSFTKYVQSGKNKQTGSENITYEWSFVEQDPFT